MQPSRYIARAAWDRMGWHALPPLGGGIFWGGHRAVSQTILSNVYVRFSCLRGPARRGKVSRHFYTFADASTVGSVTLESMRWSTITRHRGEVGVLCQRAAIDNLSGCLDELGAPAPSEHRERQHLALLRPASSEATDGFEWDFDWTVIGRLSIRLCGFRVAVNSSAELELAKTSWALRGPWRILDERL